MSTLFKFSKNGKGTIGTKAPLVAPKRTPTDSSYYDCNGVVNDKRDPSGRAWHYARDVRAQVQAERPPIPASRGYPSKYTNRDNEVPNLSVAKPYTHVPITPGQSRPYKRSDWLGAHRAVYNENDRAKVDVMYHDPKKPIPPGAWHHPFTKAEYVPKAAKPVATQQPARR